MNFDYISFLKENSRQFFDYITETEVNQRIRFGQFTMNYLNEKFPEIVVPEEYDCFYDDKKVSKLIEYLASL